MRRDFVTVQEVSEELRYISHTGTMLREEVMLPSYHTDRLQRSFIHSTNTNGRPGPTLGPGY